MARTETKIVFYKSPRALQNGIRKMERAGWSVLSTETVDQGHGCLATGCLGAIFLPLALAGKKANKHKVTYQKYK